MLDIGIAALSERGARDINEDALRYGRADGACWAVLADGAGGHAGGADAARCAVGLLDDALGSGAFGARALADALRVAHAEVRTRGERAADERLRPHATAVALWIDTTNARALWSHVGDSRLYRFRRCAIASVTRDDSVVQQMVDAGLLSAVQARGHPNRNQLLAALGIDGEVEPHTLHAPQALEEGDAFLLCSDGWWEPLDDAVIASTLAQANTPDEWLDAMRERIAAAALPHQDNYSAIAVWVGDAAATTRAMAFDSGEEAS